MVGSHYCHATAFVKTYLGGRSSRSSIPLVSSRFAKTRFAETRLVETRFAEIRVRGLGLGAGVRGCGLGLGFRRIGTEPFL